MDCIKCYDSAGDRLEALYQWDSGQVIKVHGVDTSVELEVQFCSIDDKETMVVEHSVEDSFVITSVPNILLQRSVPIMMYICRCDDSDSSQTIAAARIVVTPKAKPTGYIYTESEVLNYRTLDKRMEEIRDKLISVEIKSPEAIGDNLLKSGIWKASFPECELVASANGVYTVAHNKQIGSYLEQITESSIVPHVGYYVNGNLEELKDEVPSEAAYLTDAVYDTASNVKGSAPCDLDSGMIPAAVLDLEAPALIGRVDITCRPGSGSISEFRIQVKDTSGVWRTVKEVVPTDGPFINGKGTEQYTFDPVLCTNVRVLITDCAGDYPKILEITLYEVKEGRILEQVKPISVETDADPAGGYVGSIIDGDRNTNYQTFKFYPKSFTFKFAENTTISRMKIFAYSNEVSTPKKIIVEALVDGEWMDIFGSTKPIGNKNYESVPIYAAGLTDTFVLDLDKDYVVSAIRMYVSSPIGSNILVLNEVEFYGPAESNTAETTIGVVYADESADIIQKAGDVWYFGAKVACEKYSKNGRPKVVFEAGVNGEHMELSSSMAVTDGIADYYCTFVVPEDHPGSFENMSVKVQYFNTKNVAGKICEFSGFVLVNLTETYGAGNEPAADEYYKLITAPALNIRSAEGTQVYRLSDGLRGVPGQTAYEYAVAGGYTGTEAEFAELMAAGMIEVTPFSKGANILKDEDFEPLPQCEITGEDGGILTVVHNPLYGDYLEQITESSITPHVGYYVKGNMDELVDEVPDEAKYLTDACYNSLAYIKGSETCDYSRLIPAAVLDLDHAVRIGAVDLTARMKAGVAEKAPTKFDIQVKDVSGSWHTVAQVTEDPFFLSSGTVKYTFDPVFGTNVRVLIYESLGDFPGLLEIGVYEVKSGKVIEKITPKDVTTTTTKADPNGDEVGVVIDGDKYSHYETFNFWPDGFTFHFDGVTTINRVKILAYHNQKYTPKKIILEALIDGVWRDVFGSNKPNAEGKKYTSVPIYAVGLTDTFVLDFGCDYDVTAVRLYMSSSIGNNTVVLNEVEFYGPPKSPKSTEQLVGIQYNNHNPNAIQGDNEVWYFGAKIACEGCSEYYPPDIAIGVDRYGTSDIIEVDSVSGNFKDFYRTFRLPKGSLTGLKVCATRNGSGLVYKFTDMVLVNLSEVYGEDEEPSAEEYYKLRKSFLMSVHDQDGVKRYILDGSGVKSVNGKTGDVNIGAVLYDAYQGLSTSQKQQAASNMGAVLYGASQGLSTSQKQQAANNIGAVSFYSQSFTDTRKAQARTNIGAAPSGYGWGETSAKYISYQELNSLRITGLYDLYRPYNSPDSSENYWMVLVLTEDYSITYQIAFNRNKGVWMRHSLNSGSSTSSWAEWKEAGGASVASGANNDEWKLLTEYSITEGMDPAIVFSINPLPQAIRNIGVCVVATPDNGDFPNKAGVGICFGTSYMDGSMSSKFEINAFKISDGYDDVNLTKQQLHLWVEAEVNHNMPIPVWRGFSHGRTDSVKLVGYSSNATEKPIDAIQLRTLSGNGVGWNFGPGTTCRVYYK